MTNRNKRLTFFGLAIALITIYVGCSQPEDVLVRVSNTYVYLDEVWNFPSSYDGMQYELWVADASDTVSMGKFGYNNKLRKFYDEFGAEKSDSNRFLLSDDFLLYRSVFISVEKYPDPNPSRPSAIMLIDNATEPSVDAIDMVFPEISDTIPLWSAIVRFSMETVSDDSTFIKSGHLGVIQNTRNVSSNGYGIWFANYRRNLDSLRDTVRVDSFVIRDTMKRFDKDTIIISRKSIDSVWIDTIQRVFGIDTLPQIVARYTSELFTDTLDLSSDIDSDTLIFRDSVKEYIIDWYLQTVPYPDSTPRQLFTDTFSQDAFRLPNLERYGWKYKGWIVSPLLDTSYGTLNPPGWGVTYNDTAHNFITIPGDFGGLITTGTFSEIDGPDDANLYVKSLRIPPNPGDEFFQNLPGGSDPINLLPNATGNTGTVFITLEPIALQSPDNKTNFPLFVMIRALPTKRSEIEVNLQNNLTMRNWTGAATADRGFPKIRVLIERF